MYSLNQMEDWRRKTRLKLYWPVRVQHMARVAELRTLVCSLTLFCVLCHVYCANDETPFALRPFQASPHLMRRQDGLLQFDVPTNRHLSPNEPNLVPILTAPVPRGSPVNTRPSFQRIRLNKPQSAPSGLPHTTPPPLPPLPPKQNRLPPPPPEFVSHFSPNESPLMNFQRVAGMVSAHQTTPSFAQPQLQSGFVQNNSPPRQSFRRVKPPSGGTRRIKIKNLTTLPPTTPARSMFEMSNRRVTSPAPTAIANSDQLRGRGPINAQDDDLSHKPNALDNEEETDINFGNRYTPPDSGSADNGVLMIESLSRSSTFEPARTTVQQPVPTPTIPLTYYTTYTYFTTVLRGPHTALLSREQVSTTMLIKPIDRNIVTAIESNDGFIQPSRTQMALGTKTKGLTTTIYNVASRVQVFNEDLYKVIFATRPHLPHSSNVNAASSSGAPSFLQSEPVQTVQGLQVDLPASTSAIKLESLQNKAKKQIAKYTYFYTFIEGTNTRFSTRMEETTTRFVGDLATLTASVDPTIDGNGVLHVISPTKTVPLGSRAHGHLTTVVNLALNNYIQFDGVKNIQLDIQPSKAVPELTFNPTQSASLFSSLEESVSSFENEASSMSTQMETPKLTSQIMLHSSFVPLAPSSSIELTQPTSRVRPSSSRRPIRVKVKPIRSKLVNQLSRISSKVPISSINTESANISSSSSQSYSMLQMTPMILDSIASSNSINVEPTPSFNIESVSTPILSSRKKVSFTVRKPGYSGINRFFSRRPSSHILLHNRATSSENLPSQSYSSSSSMFLESTAIASSSIQSVPNSPTPIVSFDISATSSQSPITSPKSSRYRYKVFSRIAGAVNNWSPMYASRIRVSSRKIFKSTQVSLDSIGIEPSSTVETLYETTTHTVPFTFGTSTIYTTVEETNSKVVTRPESLPESSFISPSFESTLQPYWMTNSETFSTPTVQFDTGTTQIEPNLTLAKPNDETLSTLVAVPKLEPSSLSVVVETSDVLTTSTLYSTFTYFATLFNGTQTLITPLEEVKTEYLTLREPLVMTRTIMASSIVPTIGPARNKSEEHKMTFPSSSLITETVSTHTTLTHFITLFSGSHTILSSIEEVSPTIVFNTRSLSPMSSSMAPKLFSSQTSQLASNNLASGLGSSTEPLITKQPLSSFDMTGTVTPSSTWIVPSLSSTQSTTNNSTSEIVPNTSEENNVNANSTAMLKPGSVIELNDLLQGVQDAGEIGETIKDIVNNIVTNGNQNEDGVTTTSQPDGEDGGDDTTTVPSLSSSTLSPSFNPSTKASISPKNRYPVYISSQNLPKYFMSSSEQDRSMVIFSTQSANSESEPPMSTKYVTSIDKSIRTLTLTSTKVYYTRDSPLTITSLLTTTIPPITYVSTIIGSKTILGTYNSITPTKTIDSSLSHPSSTQSASSILIASSAVPTVSTSRPRLHRPKSNEPSVVKAKVTPFLTSRKNGKPGTTTVSPLITKNITGLDHCNLSCNMTNKEYCKDMSNGKYSCECRPGYVRRPSDNLCQEIKNYLVMVRVSKTAESEVAATSSNDNDLQNYARVARRQVGKSIAGLQVLSVDKSTKANGALVNLTIQIDHRGNSNNVQDELVKKLQPLGQVEKIVDFDECSSSLHNDCSPRARCINEPGSYNCQCLESYIDLDQTLPGRLCVSEVKSCDYCHGRGDCWRNQSDTVCRCHPMFIGRRCEINGLLLAILVPIVAILVIVAIIAFLYCSRKLRHRNRRFKNLTAYGPVAVIGGTLDRKAMLETSSESSDPQHRSSHYTNESNPASARGSMARRSASRRESEPSLDRSLASYSATGSHYNSLPPQIMIPRARPPYTLHPGQVYMW